MIDLWRSIGRFLTEDGVVEEFASLVPGHGKSTLEHAGCGYRLPIELKERVDAIQAYLESHTLTPVSVFSAGELIVVFNRRGLITEWQAVREQVQRVLGNREVGANLLGAIGALAVDYVFRSMDEADLQRAADRFYLTDVESVDFGKLYFDEPFAEAARALCGAEWTSASNNKVDLYEGRIHPFDE